MRFIFKTLIFFVGGFLLLNLIFVFGLSFAGLSLHKGLNLVMNSAIAASKSPKNLVQAEDREVIKAAQEAKEEPSAQTKQGQRNVNVEQRFPAKLIKKVEISTYENLKIEMSPAEDSTDVKVEVTGQGTPREGQGDKLADWFEVKRKGSKLVIESHDEDDDNVSLKEFFKRGGDLKISIIFPIEKTFTDVEVNTVSGDFTAKVLNTSDLKIKTVSGEIVLKRCKGEELDVKSVSSDLSIEDLEFRESSFKTVSGDAIIKSNQEKPQVDFKSVSGDLKLMLPATADVEIKFEALTGRLTNEFGTNQPGAGKVHFSSLSGDVEITKIK